MKRILLLHFNNPGFDYDSSRISFIFLLQQDWNVWSLNHGAKSLLFSWCCLFCASLQGQSVLNYSKQGCNGTTMWNGNDSKGQLKQCATVVTLLYFDISVVSQWHEPMHTCSLLLYWSRPVNCTTISGPLWNICSYLCCFSLLMLLLLNRNLNEPTTYWFIDVILVSGLRFHLLQWCKLHH